MSRFHVPGPIDQYFLGMFLHGQQAGTGLDKAAHTFTDTMDLFSTIHIAWEIEWELITFQGYWHAMMPIQNQIGFCYSPSTSGFPNSEKAPRANFRMLSMQETHQELMWIKHKAGWRAKFLIRIISQNELPGNDSSVMRSICHSVSHNPYRFIIYEPDDEEMPVTNTPIQHEEYLYGESDELHIQYWNYWVAAKSGEPQTTKLKGKVMGSTLLVMVDSQASYFFISKKVGINLNLGLTGLEARWSGWEIVGGSNQRSVF